MTAYLKQVFITSGSTTTLPADWDPNHNLVECYGSGGNGGNGSGNTAGPGGGGGAYAGTTNLNIAAGTVVNIGIGTPSTPNTWFNATSLANAVANGASVSVGAQGASASTGGAAASSVGGTTFSGGNGATAGTGSGQAGGSGGGAAGPNGAGKNAGTSDNAQDSGGGGAANNGSVGTNATGSAGGAGGNGRLGSGGGTVSGGNATANSGGGGGGCTGPGSTAGGSGALDNIYADSSHGPGGGGAGGVGNASGGAAGNGGAGGGFGSGGGGGGGSLFSTAGSGGAGQGGLIVLSYNPRVATAAGTYTITGNAVTLNAGATLSAAAGSYAITGRSVTIAAARKLLATGWAGPTSGLTHRWPMDDGDVSGTTVTDVAGALNGTSSGSGVSSARGPYGTSRAFDGASDIALSGAPLTLASAWTIGMWVYIPDVTANSPDAGGPTWFGINDSTNQMRMGNTTPATAGATVGGFYLRSNAGGGFDIATSALCFYNSSWTHVCVTFDGVSTYTLYINGSSVPFTGVASSSGLGTSNMIGARDVGARNFTGRLSQVVTYNRALSSGEVLTLFKAEPIFAFKFVNATLSPGLPAKSAQYFLTGMAVQLPVKTVRKILQITKPANRQMVDPNTGLLTNEWQLKLEQMINALNNILTNRNQS